MTGLTSEEARKRLEKFGLNTLPEKPPPSSFFILLDQFKSPLVYVLLFAALITLFLRDFPDTVIILFAVFINTILGFYQERKAKQAFYVLAKILTPQAKVIRDEEKKIIDARKLVPEDLVVLEIGDKIPADGVFLQAVDLSVNEAILTGESQPVKKKENEPGFMGTIVASGRGLMRVSQTGTLTKMGQIAKTLEEKEEKTPLEKQLAQLAKTLAILVGLAALFIFLSGIILGKSVIEMFTTAVALAVAAIPEGLLVSLTVILAIGMQRILKRKALVKNLASAETLGSVTVICADKTGTLTEGKMRVVDYLIEEPKNRKTEELLLKAVVLCNNMGDPLEVAMMEWALRQKAQGELETIKNEYPRLDEIPFSPKYKYIATLHPGILFLFGAPEVVLRKCKAQSAKRKVWEQKFEEYGSKGYRLVGFATAETQNLAEAQKIFASLRPDARKRDRDSASLRFLGLLLYEDPVRPEVEQVLKECQTAGIKVKIITGDYLETSIAVLEKLGIKIKKDEVIEGEELEKISPEELKKRIDKIVLFARTDPFQKLKIVQALKDNGEVVAMMGDGVNDAPALQTADIGIVVRESSEVAKETADIILLDSNFKTIVAAIEEGRGIFDNLRKIVLYLLADAFGELLVIFGALLVGLPLPLVAGQILWINLAADSLPDLALAVDPKRKGLMRELPRNPKESLLNLEMKSLVFLVSLFAGISTLVIFSFMLRQTDDLFLSRSLAFAVLGTNSLFYVFSCRSLRQPVWQTNIFSNRWLLAGVLAGFFLLVIPFYLRPLQILLKTVPLRIGEWLIVLLLGLLVVGIIEGVKATFSLVKK